MNTKLLPLRDALRRQLAAIPLRDWLPSRGNLLFTLLVALCLIAATTSGVLAAPQRMAAQAATSTGAIAYQGRLADASGAPLTGTYILTFRLYNAASGGSPLWEEFWIGANNVQVANGLFNVMLGSITPIPQSLFTGNSSLWLGIAVGTDAEMTPRVQLASVPYALLAQTVPDGSVTTAKLADGSVTSAKLDQNLTIGGNVSAHRLVAIGPQDPWDSGALILGNATTGHNWMISNRAGNSYLAFVLDASTVQATLDTQGNLFIGGSLTQGGLIERNLMTADEKAAARIDRFSQGDLLCWDASAQRLEKCAIPAYSFVVAVADANGKPVVLGAEPVKVLGVVHAGDFLAPSAVAGYAQVVNNAPPGMVIARALQDFTGEQGLILAMIR